MSRFLNVITKPSIILHSFYSIILLYLCLNFNSWWASVYGRMSVFGPAFFEELTKMISIYIGGPIVILYTLIFSVFEFINYIWILEAEGILTSAIVLTRLSCIGAHFSYLGIQLYGWKLYKKYGKQRWVILFFWGAVSMHMLWNLGLGRFVFRFWQLFQI